MLTLNIFVLVLHINASVFILNFQYFLNCPIACYLLLTLRNFKHCSSNLVDLVAAVVFFSKVADSPSINLCYFVQQGSIYAFL